MLYGHAEGWYQMCHIVSWPKYDNQFTNSCLAYDGS